MLKILALATPTLFAYSNLAAFGKNTFQGDEWIKFATATVFFFDKFN